MTKVDCDLDTFAAGLDELVGGIGDNVCENLKPAVKKACAASKKSVVQHVSSSGIKHHFGGVDYAGGFTYQVDGKGEKVKGEVGNENAPGLVHLLEKGHATIGGGRTRAYKHMEPGFDDGEKAFLEAAEKAVDDAL